ncbi:MAG TPA: efflux RND transporter periplasmic adaptor subunit [Campylobacterales bacterium]|nr:efflux RND transporter periplasmic adaptor subunit [Campylobacterales bacterium]
MRLLIASFLSLFYLSAEILKVEQLFNIETIKVKKVNFSYERVYYGYLKSDDSKNYDFVLRFDGYIVELFANKRFEYIKKGDPLFKIYSPTVYAAIGELIKTKQYYKKSKNKNVLELLNSSRKKLELLGFSKKDIKKFENMNNSPKNLIIKSPYTGYIFKKLINTGSFVKKGEILYKIVNLDSIWMEANIYQSDISLIKNATKIVLEVNGVAKKIDGNIEKIYPLLDKKSRSAIVRISINNSKNLLFPNLFAKAKFLFLKKDILVLPKSAVLTKGDKYFVFIKGEFEGEYEPRLIEAEPISSQIYEIKSGLKESEEVIKKALFLFDADAQITGLYGNNYD